MKVKRIPEAIVLILFFAIGLVGFLHLFPYYRTHQILNAVTLRQKKTFVWYRIPRLTGKERKVQRVSPDLLYSYCLFDLTKGKARISVGAWPRYQSLAIYAQNADHFYSETATNGEALNLVIKSPHQEGEGIEVPFTTGFIMRRRLFPEDKISTDTDVCEVM